MVQGKPFLKKPVAKVEQQFVQVYEGVEEALDVSSDLGSTLYYLQEDVVHGTITNSTPATGGVFCSFSVQRCS